MDYRSWIKDELLERVKRNPRYSARAFSRDLGISPAYLSLLLSGRRGLNEERAFLIAERLNWRGVRKRHFTTLVRSEAAKAPGAREAILSELESARLKAPGFSDVAIDLYRLVSDWYHFAIVELTELPGFCADPARIASRLGISKTEASEAVSRLLQVGLLVAEGSALKKGHANYSTRDVPSEAIRKAHRKLLKKAEIAIETQDREERDFSGITMAIDVKKIPEAKARIRAFRREIMDLLESSPGKNAVYQLSVQLFRLDRGKPRGRLQTENKG
jgi:uncharacterized protein (TIGR02147 family)